MVAAVPSAVVDDPATAFASMRRDLLTYFGLPFYRAMLERSGFGEDIAAYDEAAGRGDGEAMQAAISERFLRALCAIGSPEDVRAGVARTATRAPPRRAWARSPGPTSCDLRAAAACCGEPPRLRHALWRRIEGEEHRRFPARVVVLEARAPRAAKRSVHAQHVPRAGGVSIFAKHPFAESAGRSRALRSGSATRRLRVHRQRARSGRRPDRRHPPSLDAAVSAAQPRSDSGRPEQELQPPPSAPIFQFAPSLTSATVSSEACWFAAVVWTLALARLPLIVTWRTSSLGDSTPSQGGLHRALAAQAGAADAVDHGLGQQVGADAAVVVLGAGLGERAQRVADAIGVRALGAPAAAARGERERAAQEQGR